MGMLFQDFVNLYFEDMKHRLKESTIISKHYMVDKKILPMFRKIPINEITPKDIRKWQNGLTAYRDGKGKPYAQTYLRAINNQITAMFNYAVKYYDLRENPCTKAGSMGKSNAEEMQFWTKAEFEQFIAAVQDKPASYTAFMTMYYTGMRVGELCALTPADVDLENNTITINKTFQRINGKDVVWAPKTPKSNRVITIPQTLADCLKTYMDKCYEIQPLLIADRLGHEKIRTTLNTYSHLYPNKQVEVAQQLENIINGTTVPDSSQMADVANL
ncbi:MAG: tyrosine-type recombinase/integrase [Clostridium cadaveris]